MFLTLFGFPDDTSNPRSRTAREIEVQAYYDEHANADSRVKALKWTVAGLLAFVCFAAWAGDVYAGEANDHLKPAVAVSRHDGAVRDTVSKSTGGSPVTVFIDGPTGFVFVYTVEGWKFVRGMEPGKL